MMSSNEIILYYGIFCVTSGSILIAMVYHTWKIKDDSYKEQLKILRRGRKIDEEA